MQLLCASVPYMVIFHCTLTGKITKSKQVPDCVPLFGAILKSTTILSILFNRLVLA
ncbi:hypothetical protein [Vibrio gallaecicus]|uniref:hypothetical protein n=1 Tax=Vibrio gallaecicus TaxID=552386 RepID=UPI0025B448D7|nr:hypothetical protein [Vibrio gallaecicus]MDN3616012.1 hypothetical protein [Vibrio gallaecicus]